MGTDKAHTRVTPARVGVSVCTFAATPVTTLNYAEARLKQVSGECCGLPVMIPHPRTSRATGVAGEAKTG